MGQNLILNMNDHGFVVRSWPVLDSWWFSCSSVWSAILSLQVCAYNRTVSKVHDFLQNEAKGSKVIGAESLEDMVSKLKKPRRIILLVKAGQAVDDFIDKLVGCVFSTTPLKPLLCAEPCLTWSVPCHIPQVPLLEAGDIIIDGGNSEYRDTTVGDRNALQQWILTTEYILTPLPCFCHLAAL